MKPSASRLALRILGRNQAQILHERFSGRKTVQSGVYMGSGKVRVGRVDYTLQGSASGVSEGDTLSVVNVGRMGHAVYQPAEGVGVVTVGVGGGGGGGGTITAHTHPEADIYDLDKYTQAEVDALLVAQDAFLELDDTPASYSGQAGKYVRVNSGETGLEFATVSGGGGSFDVDTILTASGEVLVDSAGNVLVEG